MDIITEHGRAFGIDFRDLAARKIGDQQVILHPGDTAGVAQIAEYFFDRIRTRGILRLTGRDRASKTQPKEKSPPPHEFIVVTGSVMFTLCVTSNGIEYPFPCLPPEDGW